MIELRLKRLPTVPLEAEMLSPDVLRHLDHSHICGLKIRHGRREYRLDEFFEVIGEKSDSLHLHGDLSKVRWIGTGMSGGSMRISGNVGMHLGAYMKGGSIQVDGDVDDWLGAEMKQGSIFVSGNVGNRAGGGYRGSLVGMRNGQIHIVGSAGLELGLRMRRGLLVVEGRVREFAGLHMKGGTIVLRQGADARVGAWMKRGTILSFAPLEILPSFRSSGNFQSPFLQILHRHLAATLRTASDTTLASPTSTQPAHNQPSLAVAKASKPGAVQELPTTASQEFAVSQHSEWLDDWQLRTFQRYIGDRTIAGQGEILIAQTASPEPEIRG